MEWKQLFNDGWKFCKQPLQTSYDYINSAAAEWSNVDLPHDWLIYNTNALYEDSEGWYKKLFYIDALSDKNVLIYFEGVYMDSTVYVNGHKAGEWKYGYSSFEFNITELLVNGENEIVVRAVYQSPNTRWYSGAGIYRNVWLKVTTPLYVKTDSIYTSTREENEGWYLDIDADIIHCNKNQDSCNLVLKHVLLDNEGTIAANTENFMNIKNTVTGNFQTIFIKQPKLWNLDSPYLYTLKTQVFTGDIVLHEESQKIGFRKIKFDSEKGFFLNNIHIKLHGVNQHHDLGSLGAAINKTAIKRQILKLKEMGVNAIRLSHNMPSVEILELADEMGVLIVSEAFDTWEYSKNKYDYSRFFNDWYKKDVASWIRRDRNHPSIIMWSIGNEIPDTTGERGIEITRLLKQQVLLHDPRQNAHVTIGSNHMTSEKAQECSNELLVAGYNYAERLYDEHHNKYPQWCIYGSETSSTVQSRGIYHFPANKTVIMYEDEQCSSLDNCTTSWGSKNAQSNIIYDRDADYCMGQFLWSGFDYIGEPTPYNTKNSYFGQIDTAGFEKDSFYLYQAEWTDYKKKPMVHILPYWDFNVGQMIDVIVYSNSPKIELFFNERSQGTFEIDHQTGLQLRGEWRIPYEQGVLKAVAYNETGDVVATDIQGSFGDASRILLKPDKTSMYADGQDLIFVEISMSDISGNPVANANNRVFVEVTGGGRLIGLDNGDSTDYDQYKGSSRRLFNGKLLAIIASKTTAADITVKVSSEGLPTEVLTFKTIPCLHINKGISALMENDKSLENREIPIRKIQLTGTGNHILNKSNPSTIVSAKILPENSTYSEIEWKAVTDLGIQTNIVNIEVSGNNATLTAHGDGKFRLRCTAKNGRTSPQIISDLEYVIEGMGTLLTNPYEFVEASLYHKSNYLIDSSLIGGIDTKDDITNIITYTELDFGDYGTDELSLSIYHFSDYPIPLEIWEGIPGTEGASLLLKANYQADPIWCTFQENSYKLSRKIREITSISFVFYQKLSFKGFEFIYKDKSFDRLFSDDISNIYGDSYTKNINSIDNIGNNVSLEFDNMDFEVNGIRSLTICGDSFVHNVIQVHFINENEKISHIIELPSSVDTITKEYTFSKIQGKFTVSLVFMPGDNFSYHWVQFNK
ncbi:MAG: lacZ3 [Anaerocolumna sp.]|jgi:beta-galactosidase|nr:lacZ3 [Anaerocolumna sp.]